MDITVCVWVDIKCASDYVYLFVHLPASCPWFCLSCHCTSIPTSRAGMAEKACLTPRLVRLYRTRQQDVLPWHRWHDVCHPSAVSLPFSDVALCMGPSLYFLPSLLLGMWWDAVIYKKWLGGNSSNMICVGAHKTSPSVTLKEWNGRAVLIRLPVSHCRDHKCVQNQAVGWGFSVNFYQY